MGGGSGYVTIKLRLPSILVEKLERVARRRGVRRGRLIASLLADWIEDYIEDRFEPFSTRDNRINIVDKLLGEIIPVTIMKGELYCEYCKSFTCGHTRYAKKIYARKKLMAKRGFWEICD